MKLNHLDLQVPDVPATAAFFERLYGLEIVSNRNSSAIIILSDREGFVLVLQRLAEGESYPKDFHVGFLVGNPDEVRAQHAKISAAGVESTDVEVNNRGVMFYCKAPGNITVETSWRKPHH
ncbi:MAG: VOC family protein [Polyangiaceae bacterium]|nr:VOC family protein [Polyangiaceae bacterium]